MLWWPLTLQLILLLFSNCDFTTVPNHNNIWHSGYLYVSPPKGCTPQREDCCSRRRNLHNRTNTRVSRSQEKIEGGENTDSLSKRANAMAPPWLLIVSTSFCVWHIKLLCVYVCVFELTCMHIHVCGGQKATVAVFKHHLPCHLRQVPSLT